MESKTLKATPAGASSSRGAVEAAAGPEGAGRQGAAEGVESCCVFETVVRDGRVETVCVATCCGVAS